MEEDKKDPTTSSSRPLASSAAVYGNCVSVADRYEKLGRLGEGTYGIVYQALDRETNVKVALKRCIPHHEASDGFPVTTLREIQSLRICAGHAHIVQLDRVAVSTNGVFLVFEYWYADTNTHNTHTATNHSRNDELLTVLSLPFSKYISLAYFVKPANTTWPI